MLIGVGCQRPRLDRCSVPVRTRRGGVSRPPQQGFTLSRTIVNGTAQAVGFNAILLADLWLPLKRTPSRHTAPRSIFTFSETDSTLLIRIGSLFGLLMVSFVLLLINSLILVILKRVAQTLRSRATFPTEDDRRSCVSLKEAKPQRLWPHFPNPRAPPLLSGVLAELEFT